MFVPAFAVDDEERGVPGFRLPQGQRLSQLVEQPRDVAALRVEDDAPRTSAGRRSEPAEDAPRREIGEERQGIALRLHRNPDGRGPGCSVRLQGVVPACGIRGARSASEPGRRLRSRRSRSGTAGGPIVRLEREGRQSRHRLRLEGSLARIRSARGRIRLESPHTKPRAVASSRTLSVRRSRCRVFR